VTRVFGGDPGGTDWRNWSSWRQVNAIGLLPIGGAAAAGGLAAGSLAEFVETLAAYAPEAYPEPVRRLAEGLMDRQAAIAPIVGLVNTVFLHLDDGPEALAAELRDLEQRITTSTRLLAEVGAALIADGASVLTFGGSGSVQAVLTEAASNRRVFVSCAATMPMAEGVVMAADLARLGLAVDLVPDDGVGDVIPDHDLVLMGVSALGPDAVMNIAGSAEIVEEAGLAKVPVYLVASVEKALPAVLFDRAVSAGTAEGYYEPISLGAISLVVTEFGVLDPGAAGALAAERSVADPLSDG
jgi:translation initiation factor 2B subunit (eIF-2B alpha/beta/delta family)